MSLRHGRRGAIVTTCSHGDEIMRAVPVREAKAKFSELLDAVENGEEIMITRNGKPSVRLVPGIDDDRNVRPRQKSFIRFLMEFPGGMEFERDPSPSREVNF